jgi:hypothetical protein
MAGLLNYTTSVAVEKSLAEIQTMLLRAGASGITTTYDPATRRPIGVAFRVDTGVGAHDYALPVRVAAVRQVMLDDGMLKPARYFSDYRRAREERQRVDRVHREQPERVAWRIARDWLDVQLALVQTGMVALDEVMLPYQLVDGDRPDGAPGQRTVYDLYAEQQRRLPSPTSTPSTPSTPARGHLPARAAAG